MGRGVGRRVAAPAIGPHMAACAATDAAKSCSLGAAQLRAGPRVINAGRGMHEHEHADCRCRSVRALGQRLRAQLG